MYGVLEKQFRRYFQKPLTASVATLVPTCCRCWNRVWTTSCTAWASAPRVEARQLVSHKAILVNGQAVNIPRSFW